MLYGRRLDESLEHVEGSRYALVHAVAKRARQITLWLTADPAELRAEAAPPPAPGELVTRDPVALAESEILQGEVVVRWDPEGKADELRLPEPDILDTDPLLIEGLVGEDDEDFEGEEGEEAAIAPALAQALEADTPPDEAVAAAVVDDEEEEDDDEPVEGDALEDVTDLLPDGDGDDLVEVPLDSIDDDEPEVEDEEES
jgi:DNA-directed RNA polymerase subunit K/omega